MKRARGFTLIEVLIAVAIVGILAAIAFPNYQNHIRKGRRADAQSFMMDLANRQAQYMLDARTYALDATFVTTLGAMASSARMSSGARQAVVVPVTIKYASSSGPADPCVTTLVSLCALIG